MAEESFALVVDVRPAQTWRAEVILVHDDKSVSVVCDGTESEPYRCLVLETREGGGLQLKPGDVVLIVREEGRSGIILGRIASADNVAGEPPKTQGVAPEQLVIEAKKNLTLKCGEGLITMREDGKILIKGKDLVSHAQRMNRIKGGSVSIN